MTPGHSERSAGPCSQKGPGSTSHCVIATATPPTAERGDRGRSLAPNPTSSRQPMPSVGRDISIESSPFRVRSDSSLFRHAHPPRASSHCHLHTRASRLLAPETRLRPPATHPPASSFSSSLPFIDPASSCAACACRSRISSPHTAANTDNLDALRR